MHGRIFTEPNRTLRLTGRFLDAFVVKEAKRPEDANAPDQGGRKSFMPNPWDRDNLTMVTFSVKGYRTSLSMPVKK